MSGYLTDSIGSTGSRTTFTISAWVKINGTSTNQTIFGTGTAGSNSGKFYFAISSGQVRIGGGGNVYRVSTRLFRDPSSWYHLVCAMDTTQGSDANRVKFYVNGELYTDWGAGYNSITQNQNTPVNESGKVNTFGAEQGGGESWDGYISNMVLADGAQYAASNFGETDSTTGEWKPKTDPTGVTYGTNGVFMKCENAANFGLDSSGNSNNYTATSFPTGAHTVDTPSNNFCTLNPIAPGTNLSQTTFSEGNLKVVSAGTTSSSGDQIVSSLGFTKGKWYWEIKGVSNPDNMFWMVFNDVLGGKRPYHDNYAYAMYGDGNGNNSQIYESQESAQKGYGIDSSTCFSDNDIIQFAFDCDNYRLYVGRNGQWTNYNAASGGTITNGSTFNQNNPTGYYQISTAAAQTGVYRAALIKAGSSVQYTAQINFGNPPFTIASGNADGNGLGNFEYAVPSGYYALCTKNINQYG